MTHEIFYLESCLAIEKSMVEITEACAEGIGSIDEGFLFESPKDVFATVRDKIKQLIEKVKNIFTGKMAKAQEASIAKKAEKLGNSVIEVQDADKVKKLYDKAYEDIKKGKDPNKVNDWFKKGLIALGVLTVAGAGAVGAVKYKNKKKIKASAAATYTQKVNKQVLVDGKRLDGDTAVILKHGEKIAEKAGKKVSNGNSLSVDKISNANVMTTDAIAQANGLTNLYSNYTKAFNNVRSSVVGGLNAPLTIDKSVMDGFGGKIEKYQKNAKNAKELAEYKKNPQKYVNDNFKALAAAGFATESYTDDLFDDEDLFDESFSDTDNLFGESYDDILGFVDDDDLFDDVHTI